MRGTPSLMVSHGRHRPERADSQAAIEQFLVRNPDMSYVALDDAKLATTMLVYHDGRRYDEGLQEPYR